MKQEIAGGSIATNIILESFPIGSDVYSQQQEVGSWGGTNTASPVALR